MIEVKESLLSWNGFENFVVQSFRYLNDDKSLADVTLACEDGKQISAHKIILSSCSSIFKNIILGNPHQHPVIYMKDIKHNTLQSVVEFMYLGQTRVGQEDIEDFIDTAIDLDVKGINKDNIDIMEQLGPDLEHLDQFMDKILSDYDCGIFTSFDHSFGKKHCESDQQITLDKTFPIPPKTKEPVNHTQKYKLEDGRYYCDQCDYKARQTGDVKKHILAKHKGIKFECDNCQKLFSFKHDLRKHERRFHNKKEKFVKMEK